MTVLDWILGALFKPSSTFLRATTEMRLSYWWILISIFTLEVVAAIYSPVDAGVGRMEPFVVGLYTITFIMVLFDVQGLFMMGSARLFGWPLPWIDALKYTGLSWSVLFLEDVITFYFMLKGNHLVILVVGILMYAWLAITLSAGIKAVSGLTWMKSSAVAILASAPWRGGVLWLYWFYGRG